jgi:hypothetical protein
MISKPRTSKIFQAWVFATIAVLFTGSAFAQDIDYSRFRKATFAALGARFAEGVSKDKGHVPKVGDRIFDPALSGRVVQANYTGQMRPMSDDEMNFVRDGFKSMQQEPMAALYQQSMLFQAGKDYWLPVPSAVAPYFANELKAGETIDLYVLQSGGLLQNDGWDWLFLVVDFKKPQDSPARGNP